jgi:uncharacterized repeat protein (TIGR02543 family)/prepilin-type N-terminal cleavage/methylation domain-containing protein
VENKKKKKGFTLIELLAIIVILAIIAVITVPIILNIIDNSKKGAVINSAYGYKDAINKYYISQLITEPDYRIDGTYTIDEEGRLVKGSEILQIPLSGNKPNGGELTYELQKIMSGCLTINGYKVFWNDNNVEKAEKGICFEQTTITFDSNGGTTVEPQTKNIDKKIGNLPQPTRTNYALQGWFTEQTGGTQITADTMVTGPQTYYAHWVQNAVSVTFDSREGSAVPSTTVEINHSYNQDHTVLPTPTRSGYNFLGWFETIEGGIAVTGNETLTTNKTYYAHWEKSSPLTYTDTNNDGEISVGDMVTIADQGFEVINPNKNGNVVLLAEYNLKHQQVSNDTAYIGQNNNGMLLTINKSYQTLLADVAMVWKQYNAAYNASNTYYYTTFSQDMYWYGLNGQHEECEDVPIYENVEVCTASASGSASASSGSCYYEEQIQRYEKQCHNVDDYVYRQNYDTDSEGKKYIYKTSEGYDTDNNIYKVLNAYKAYLQYLGQNIADVRLMSYAEAKGLTISQRLSSNQIYWLGSEFGNDGHYFVWAVHYSGNLDWNYYYYDSGNRGRYGVRPVIEISRSEF